MDEQEDRLFKKADAARVAVGVVWPVLLFQLIGLAAAIISTVGLLTFFFFEGLAPYRWPMIIGGGIVSFGASLIADRLKPDREAIQNLDVEQIIEESLQEMDDNDGGRS